LTNGNYYILCRNTVGVGPEFGSPHQNAATSIGGALKAAEVSAYYGSLLTYLQAVGAA
jgi:hypothetical protein